MRPGKRDVVSVRSDDREKVKVQKRHLYSSLKGTHAIFQTEHPQFRIGISSFVMLQLPQVMLSSQTPFNVCTCIYHQNTILSLDVLHSYIPGIPITAKTYQPPDTDICWYDECQPKDCRFEYLYPFPADNDLKKKCAKWLKWEEVNGRAIKNEQFGTLFELYRHTETTVKSFLPHCFVK